jgi:hypothetical protein
LYSSRQAPIFARASIRLRNQFAFKPRTGATDAAASQANQQILARRGNLYSGERALVLPVSSDRFHRRYHRFPLVGAARRRCGQAAISSGLERSVSSSAARHQYRSGTDLRLGDPGHKEGRNTPAAMPTSACAVLKQHPGAGPSSDQASSKRQARVSGIPGCAANDPRVRGDEYDPEGAGSVGGQD